MAHRATPLEALRASTAADAPLAPVHAATHARLCSVDPGHATARMPLPSGAEPVEALGSLLVLADFVLGIAVSTRLGSGTAITTVRLSAQVAGGVDLASTGAFAASGRCEHIGGGSGISSSEILGDDGVLLARAQARNAVFPDPRLDDPYSTSSATPERPAHPEPWAALVATEHDGGRLWARPDPRTSNSAGAVQGGVVAGVAARALSECLGAVPDELAATFLRPTPHDGSALACHTVLEHAGRRLRSARVELRRDERVVATASGSAYAG